MPHDDMHTYGTCIEVEWYVESEDEAQELLKQLLFGIKTTRNVSFVGAEPLEYI